ncbi:MAG: carboxypeptidase regulatory-like domain-containing protein [Candidatus Dadabacteria bacterium]|nr:MAG: carboxypeptidase regulatory-like domain-containing protein [Candidatus Dadabacteria bacterium]
MKKVILVCALFFMLNPAMLSAKQSEIVIKDTSGFTRSTASVEDKGKIIFNLVDSAGKAADGVKVTLTNSLTGESLSAVAANGKVIFSNVAPGTWTVASATPGVTFTNISVLSMAAAGGAISGTTIGLAGLGAIGAGSAVAANEASGDGKVLSPAS